MFVRARRRFLDLLASIYIYNEHRGYTSIDRVLEAVRLRHPDATDFIAAVEKHRRDERKHYVMFKRYFELLGRMPFAVDRGCGHIDRLIKLTFNCTIEELDTDEVAGSEELFQKLCRIIVLTEERGLRQIGILLRSPLVRADKPLVKIFQIIGKDEPDHFMPYQAWIERRGSGKRRLRERVADFWVHRVLVLYKVPLLYLDPRLARRSEWPDAHEAEGRFKAATAS